MDGDHAVTVTFDLDSAVVINLEKALGDVSMSWNTVPDALWYHIYQGTLELLYDHTSFPSSGTLDGPDSCSEPVTSVQFDQPVGNVYFLVVSGNNLGEGSYGTDSSGAERPAAVPACQ